jgi:hypothetical protein
MVGYGRRHSELRQHRRRRLRGGGIVDDIYRAGRHGLHSLVHKTIHGVRHYVPIPLLKHIKESARSIKNHAIDLGAAKLKEVTGGRAQSHKSYSQTERLKAIRSALSHRMHGKGLRVL